MENCSTIGRHTRTRSQCLEFMQTENSPLRFDSQTGSEYRWIAPARIVVTKAVSTEPTTQVDPPQFPPQRAAPPPQSGIVRNRSRQSPTFAPTGSLDLRQVGRARYRSRRQSPVPGLRDRYVALSANRRAIRGALSLPGLAARACYPAAPILRRPWASKLPRQG